MRTSLILGSLAFALTALAVPDASASPAIQMTSPTGTVIGPVPLIRLMFSAASAPLDLGSFRVSANGVDLTAKFALSAGSAEYAVAASESSVAGEITMVASIADADGETATVSSTFVVLP